MKEIIDQINAKKIGSYLESVDLKKYNTYRIGGKASLMVWPNGIDELVTLIKIIRKEKIKYKVLGKGSNVIFSDKLYDGVIIKLDCLNKMTIVDDMVTIEAGADAIKTATSLCHDGYATFAFATGIPGTIGGLIYNNAGAYQHEIADYLLRVKVLNPNLEIMEMNSSQLNFRYRHSFFKEHPDYIILDGTFRLEKASKKEITDLVNDRRQRRFLSQPLEYPSAGSIFRNPEGDYAGKLIEECGLKGAVEGGAMVSEKHANFIINYNKASALDVKKLIDRVKKTVMEEKRVELIEEQEYINWE